MARSDLDRSPTARGAFTARCSVPALVLVVWGAGVIALAAADTFRVPPGALPVPTILAILGPVALFLLAYRASAGLRARVAAVDPRLLTGLHAWRTIGFVFLVLYAAGDLPGVFAWPAALGDIAIAVSAPCIVRRLERDACYVSGRSYRVWHLLGLLDFAVAVGTGVLASGGLPALFRPGVTTAPLAEMPLILIPAFLVPFFVTAHLAAILGAPRRIEVGSRPESKALPRSVA